MFQHSLVRESDVEPLGEAVCRVLEKTGVLCENAELLTALKGAGATVDEAAQRVRFPVRLVQSFVEQLREQGPIDLGLDMYGDATSTGAASTDAVAASQRRFVVPGPPELGTQVAQFYYDYPTRSRRPGNRNDLIALIKLADVLQPNSRAGHAIVQGEIHPKLEALESAMLLAEYAHRPGEAFAWYLDQIDYLKEMGDVLGIEKWYSWGSVCFAHPLRMDRDVADKFVRRVKEGVPTGLTAMPIAGFTTPATAEGFIAVAAAEHLATWLAARVLNPACPLTGSQWAGSIDMKTGAISYSSFDSMYLAFALVEFLRRWTGLNLPVGGGEYCDAREPGLYAAMEKAYKSMTIAAFTGQHPNVGEGMLEEGKTIAPVQLLIERDLHSGVTHFGRHLEVTGDRLALDEILEVDLGFLKNHMGTAHTVAHFRQSLWLPKLIERSGWNGAEGDARLLDNAQDRIDRLLRTYQKPTGREDQLARMRQIVDRAKQKLVG